MDRSIELADGRRLSYVEFGARDGTPILALHGTPGSRLKFSVVEPVGRALGLRVIAIDRWGYGGTDAPPAPSLHQFAEDTRDFADALGLGSFAVMGISGGGPYAVAVASMLPARVSALALIAPVGPIAQEPDREIAAFHRFCFGPLARSPVMRSAVFIGFRRLLLTAPRLAMSVAMARVPSSDKAVLGRGQTRARLAGAFTEGLRFSARGPSIDMMLFGRPWEVPLANADMPARLWLGTADRNVPLSAARRLAARLPRCVLRELPGAGHLWVAEHYDEVLQWISETERRGPCRAAPPNLFDGPVRQEPGRQTQEDDHEPNRQRS